MKNRMYELPSYDRKSFYGKAFVIEKNGVIYLRSYNTIVAKIEKGVFIRVWGGYSATTMRHVNSFLIHHGCRKISKKEWEAMEVA